MVSFEPQIAEALLEFLAKARAQGVRRLRVSDDGFEAEMEPLPPPPPPQPTQKSREEQQAEADDLLFQSAR